MYVVRLLFVLIYHFASQYLNWTVPSLSWDVQFIKRGVGIKIMD